MDEDCWSQAVEGLQLDSFSFWPASGLFVLFIVLVVFGNLLIMLAVCMNTNLHTTTNYIVTSLAVSDFLIGLFILPFSSFQALSGNLWPWGQVVCQVWLASDVWLCTASIYNLVAISFDRFMAVTRPMTYRYISSESIGRKLVLGAWFVSFAICAPPVLLDLFRSYLQNDVSIHPVTSALENRTTNSATVHSISQKDIDPFNMSLAANHSSCVCTPLHNESGYIIYSAAGSFIIPLLLIFYLNLTIFKHARHAGQIKLKRPKSQNKSGQNGNESAEANDTLMRVHRGGGIVPTKKLSPPKIRLEKVHSDSALDRRSTSATPNGYTRQYMAAPTKAAKQPTPNPPNMSASQTFQSCVLKKISVSEHNGLTLDSVSVQHVEAPPSPTPLLPVHKAPMAASALEVISRKAKVTAAEKHHSYERRVAKTILVVIVCFTVCWMPFTVIYSLQIEGVCTVDTGCIPKLLFGVCFWLGYINSSINPFIYALFSRELRRAFRRTLMRLVCMKDNSHRHHLHTHPTNTKPVRENQLNQKKASAFSLVSVKKREALALSTGAVSTNQADVVLYSARYTPMTLHSSNDRVIELSYNV